MQISPAIVSFISFPTQCVKTNNKQTWPLFCSFATAHTAFYFHPAAKPISTRKYLMNKWWHNAVKRSPYPFCSSYWGKFENLIPDFNAVNYRSFLTADVAGICHCQQSYYCSNCKNKRDFVNQRHQQKCLYIAYCVSSIYVLSVLVL